MFSPRAICRIIERILFFQEFLRCIIDGADLLGLAFVLSQIPGKSHSKLITAGLGWATAEVILSRGLLLWVGARGAEFSWIYIQKCLDSNIALVKSNLIITIKATETLIFHVFVITDSAFNNCYIDMAIHSA